MNALRAMLIAAMLQTGAAKQEIGAAVEGIVVARESGLAIAGAVVELSGIAAPGLAVSDWRVRSFSTVTAGDGTFALKDVAPGAAYQLVVTRSPDFVPAVHGQDHPNDPWVPIALAPGQRLTGVRVTLRELSGVSGRVVNDDNKPLRNTRVSALELGYLDGHRILRTASSTSTDAGGNYRIAGLTPGRYVIRIRPPTVLESSGSPRELSATGPYLYFPGTLDPNGAAGIDVGQTTNVGGLNLAAALIRLRRVRGTVILAGKETTPLQARVFLIPPGAAPDSSLTREFISSNGEFDFRDVAPGAYTLFAVAGNAEAPLSGRLTVTIDNSNLQELKLAVRPDIDIEGRITVDDPVLAGSIDFSHTAVTVSAASRATVDRSVHPAITAERARDPVALPRRVVPSSDGRFTLKGLRSWLYFPAATVALDRNTPEPLRTAYVKSILLGTVDVLKSGEPFDPTAGGVPAGVLSIVLGTDAGALEGRIFDENRHGMPHTVVALVPDAPHRNRRDLFHIAPTDAGGRFAMQAIAPGNYKVFAWRSAGTGSGAWFFPEFLQPHEGRASAVTIAPRERKFVEAPLLTSEP